MVGVIEGFVDQKVPTMYTLVEQGTTTSTLQKLLGKIMSREEGAGKEGDRSYL